MIPATRRRTADRALSHHILPSAATMVGICATLIGLVKIIEARIGPSHVDEFAAFVGLTFLLSALTSYLSLRGGALHSPGVRLEKAADVFFLLGLVGLSVISLLFAYEAL